MALIDLTALNLFDLILASSWPDEKQYEIGQLYMQAFSEALINAVGRELDKKDFEAVQKLLQDPAITPESLMQFYTDRIPQLEEKVVMLALSFKKSFVLDVYQNKLDEYNNSDDRTGLEAWEQVLKDAQADNWNEVMRLLKVIESMGNTQVNTPAAPPQIPPVTV
jgi:hypothetical protein